MVKIKQSRNFSLIVYCNNANEILDTINNIDNINAYAFILHDKDVNSKNKIKENHFHLLLRLKSARNITCVKNYFKFYVNDQLQNVFCEFATDLNSCFEYLTHKNNPDRFQYNECDIVTNDKFAFIGYEKEKDNCLNIINDLLNKVPLRKMIALYGRELVYHFKAFKEICNCILMEDNYNEHMKKVREWEDTQINDCEKL